MKKLIGILVIATLVMAGCANVKPSHDEYMAAVAAAKSAKKKATAVGYEWRDTGKMIKKAEEIAKGAADSEKAGDKEAAIAAYQKAAKLARKAEKQSHDAVKQQMQQANAGPVF
ncbi:MAG: hypothetical protein EP297_07185 [Gammaproteobacteria bacterium]|nr:MAG: hypothetical protein EP297_07185 [Gammaproteobacteria bacterium]